MKQYLTYAGLFVACFLVINVGMYFFLHSTQPALESAMNEAADSTSTVVDSVSVVQSASADSPAAATPVLTPDEHTQLVEALGGVATEPVDTSIATKSIQSMYEEPVAANEVSELQQPDTDPNLLMAGNDSEYNTPAIDSAEISPQNLPQSNPKELNKLAKLLEGMKPAEAAAIASRLGIEEIVALVMKMKDRKAAKMMAELPVDKAAQVAERMSEIIAQGDVKS
jgi:hypothetical protein